MQVHYTRLFTDSERIAFRGLSRLPLAAASEEKDPQDMAQAGDISTEAVSTS